MIACVRSGFCFLSNDIYCIDFCYFCNFYFSYYVIFVYLNYLSIAVVSAGILKLRIFLPDCFSLILCKSVIETSISP